MRFSRLIKKLRGSFSNLIWVPKKPRCPACKKALDGRYQCTTLNCLGRLEERTPSQRNLRLGEPSLNDQNSPVISLAHSTSLTHAYSISPRSLKCIPKASGNKPLPDLPVSSLQSASLSPSTCSLTSTVEEAPRTGTFVEDTAPLGNTFSTRTALPEDLLAQTGFHKLPAMVPGDGKFEAGQSENLSAATPLTPDDFTFQPWCLFCDKKHKAEGECELPQYAQSLWEDQHCCKACHYELNPEGQCEKLDCIRSIKLSLGTCELCGYDLNKEGLCELFDCPSRTDIYSHWTTYDDRNHQSKCDNNECIDCTTATDTSPHQQHTSHPADISHAQGTRQKKTEAEAESLNLAPMMACCMFCSKMLNARAQCVTLNCQYSVHGGVLSSIPRVQRTMGGSTRMK